MEQHWGAAKHNDSVLALHPAGPGSILCVPKTISIQDFFLLMLLRFIDDTAYNSGKRLVHVN